MYKGKAEGGVGRSESARSVQFEIAQHYDVMAELDRDVHENERLSATEVATALRLMGRIPKTVFLPCFGTGRHIPALLKAGVERIVGVDLSPKCVVKAHALIVSDPRVELIVGDLATWRTDEQFEAVIVLGNSFGDITDEKLLARVTEGMVKPLTLGGIFVMDYIGPHYLDRCRDRAATVWEAVLEGHIVKDLRSPRYDEASRVMTIDVVVTDATTGVIRWQGSYQKIILTSPAVADHFRRQGVMIYAHGRASAVNREYYEGQTGELGMIARSTWWVGHKE